MPTGVAALCRSLGNVCLLFIADHRVNCYVIDLALFKGRPEKYLESFPNPTPKQVVENIMPSVVAQYSRTSDGKWSPVKIDPASGVAVPEQKQLPSTWTGVKPAVTF
jgi:hypothetical protein